jgi:hypothetical protein
VDKEQCGGWCGLALKRTVAGMVSQVQCGEFWRRDDLEWSKLSHFSLESGPSFVSLGSAIAASMSWSGAETFFPVHVLRMELDLCCLPDYVLHAISLHGQDPRVLKLDTVTQH